MKYIPFLLRSAESGRETAITDVRDALASADPLPDALDTDTSGHVLVRETRKTAVKPETTDDK